MQVGKPVSGNFSDCVVLYMCADYDGSFELKLSRISLSQLVLLRFMAPCVAKGGDVYYLD